MTSPIGNAKASVSLNFSNEEAERLQSMAPNMSLDDIVKSSLELLGKAAEALAAGHSFGSCEEDGSDITEPRMPALDAARNHETRYV